MKMSLANKLVRCLPGLSAMFFAVSAPADDAIQTIAANDPAAMQIPVVTGPELWKDPSQPIEARVHDLVSRMTLAEKVSQLPADACAIPRLGIPAYSYRNECLHGVVTRAGPSMSLPEYLGVGTVFPQGIGMAATWDPPLVQQEADAIATEGRAKFNEYSRLHDGASVLHTGISFYAPNINIFRDPRWGRGQETYGEDPFLTSQFAIAYIRGLQGDDPKYFKAIACAKHFAVHSGPEFHRQSFNATPPERDLYETYLPAFQAAVQVARVGSVMGSYNALDGTPNCANPFLLTQVLRKDWGFQGYVVSDGGAIRNLWAFHKYVPTPEEAAAAAVKAGCDLFSSDIARMSRRGAEQADIEALGRLLQKHLLTEPEIDAAVSYSLAARFQLGLFDPPSLVPWSKITMADNDTPAHRALALKVAQESIVLLKNDGLLPLKRSRIKRIAVIGPNADSEAALLGNYAGMPSKFVTLLDGIRQVAGTNIQVTYEFGGPLAVRNDDTNQPAPEMTTPAVAAAAADVIIYVGGLDASLEKESGNDPYQGFLGGDRTRIELPAVQEDLIKALFATGKPVILINCSGSALAIPWEAAHLPAILQAWYPGEEGGLAVAQVLFGEVNPAGRLPITFYQSTDDLPDFTDYSMSNRTYRYFSGQPLYAFGHGLSYTKFKYAHAALDSATVPPAGALTLSFTIKNTGAREGDEVAQVYFCHIKSAVPQPRLALCGCERIHLGRRMKTKVSLTIPAERFRYWDVAKKQYVIEPGDYELLIGAASDDIRARIPFSVSTTP